MLSSTPLSFEYALASSSSSCTLSLKAAASIHRSLHTFILCCIHPLLLLLYMHALLDCAQSQKKKRFSPLALYGLQILTVLDPVREVKATQNNKNKNNVGGVTARCCRELQIKSSYLKG